ncbi:MAG: hypothetical protein JXX28_09565 [Deltaproteobacteria bacterium]|nr:hypothetical protein [Deltaproteobacteria bacterium]
MITPLRVEVPLGEVVDRLTILDLKISRLPSADARANALRERDALREAWRSCGLGAQAGQAEEQLEWRPLSEVNLRLWEVEDALRHHEALQRFDGDFVSLARSVYQLNDERAALKRAINLRLGSRLVEEKSYPDYRAPSHLM